MAPSSYNDPSTPVSARLQKWAVFSAGLALFGLGSDLLAALLSPAAMSWTAILGRGELYMVTIGMLFGAAGELLYERTRLEPAAAWQVSVAVLTMIMSLFPASLFALAKADKSDPSLVSIWSLSFFLLAVAWGTILILLTKSGGNNGS